VCVGKFEIAVFAVKGVLTPTNVHLRNIYVRCWLSSNLDLKLKSQPNLVLVPESNSSYSPTLDQTLDFLCFHSIRPKNLTVYFEVFGDYLRSQDASCYAFDQSLGIGTISIDKISENLRHQWVKLSYSTVGESLIQIELLLSTYFSPQESRIFTPTRKENQKVKSQSFPVEPLPKEANEKPQARESDGSNQKFSWTKKFTSVFTRSNRENQLKEEKQETVPEVIETPSTEALENIPDDQPTDLPTDLVDPSIDRKSKKWRNSLALLTGEIDLNDQNEVTIKETSIESNPEEKIRRSEESILSQRSSDQDGTARSTSIDLSKTKKRMSVALSGAHPLEIDEINELAEPPPQNGAEPHPPSQSNETPSTAPLSNSLLIQSKSEKNILTQSPLISNGKTFDLEHQQRDGSVTTEVAGSVKSEYQKVQQIADLQNYFHHSFAKVGLGISSMTPCTDCGHTLLDEEFMSCWGGFCDHPKDMSADIYSSHIIICPICKSEIIPKLHIKLYQLVPLDSTLSSTDLVEETSTIECIWSSEVHHLSPFGLRLLTEHILEQEGFLIAEAEWMLLHHPEIYWNSLWYATRLNLPNGFYTTKTLSSVLSSLPPYKSKESSSNEPFVWVSNVTVGWRECVLRAKIFRTLLDGQSEGILTLRDVFPGLTKEDEQLACEIINTMDGTVANVASSLTRINKLSSLWSVFSGTKGRKLYLAFLSLVQFYHPPCLLQCSPEIPHGLSKVKFSPSVSPSCLMTPLLQGTQFDRALIEALSIAFTSKDFEILQTKESELNIATSNRAAQAIRIALGYLL
jgi:hypothetical protein